MSEGLGVRLRAPSFYLGSQFVHRHTIENSLALRSVVTTACAKLTKESNRINDAKFSHERVMCSLRYLRDWIKVCAHWDISEIRSRMETGTTVRFGSNLARRSSLSSAVTK